MKDQITTVVPRYKGVVYAWDVVNEVISDKEDIYFRSSLLYHICGKEFVAKASEYGHAADLDASLFYNYHTEISPIKRKKIFQLFIDLG